MIEMLAGFYKTNKILFWLLLPITLGAMLIKMYLDYNMYKAEKELKETQKKDDQLKKEQDEANHKAEEHRAKAEALEEDIKKRNEEEELDLDWHKK